MQAKKAVKKKKDKPPPILLYADSDGSPDQLYFGRFFAPDPFISIGVDGKKIGVFNDLEIARARKESAFDEIFSWDEWKERIKKKNGKGDVGAAEIILEISKERGIRQFHVPEEFPYGLASKLNHGGLELKPVEGGLFPQRELKNDEEARAIRKGNACSAAGIHAAEKVLRASAIRDGKIFYQDRFLTSERLKEAIEIACLEAGGVAGHTIAAGGDQACDPHCSGSGILRANELIIVDVFPRLKKGGYHGDMTRTFLKGEPSDEQRGLVAAVSGAHAEAVSSLRAGVSGDEVHRKVISYFEKKGYRTGTDDGVPVGFFHGTGHGLGLAVHEAPRISLRGPQLRDGHVVTIEPGLYYPGLGAVRIEDVFRVKADGAETLSKCSYHWIIK